MFANIDDNKDEIMINFDNRIQSLQPVDWSEIQNHYGCMFQDAIVALLNKLGYGEGDEFKFEEKKRKSRMGNKGQVVLSIKYTKFTIPQDPITQRWFRYDFEILYLTGDPDPRGEVNMMIVPPTCPEADFWSDVYNYLRIEAKSRRRVKQSNPT